MGGQAKAVLTDAQLVILFYNYGDGPGVVYSAYTTGTINDNLILFCSAFCVYCFLVVKETSLSKKHL